MVPRIFFILLLIAVPAIRSSETDETYKYWSQWYGNDDTSLQQWILPVTNVSIGQICAYHGNAIYGLEVQSTIVGSTDGKKECVVDDSECFRSAIVHADSSKLYGLQFISANGDRSRQFGSIQSLPRINVHASNAMCLYKMEVRLSDSAIGAIRFYFANSSVIPSTASTASTLLTTETDSQPADLESEESGASGWYYGWGIALVWVLCCIYQRHRRRRRLANVIAHQRQDVQQQQQQQLPQVPRPQKKQEGAPNNDGYATSTVVAASNNTDVEGVVAYAPSATPGTASPVVYAVVDAPPLEPADALPPYEVQPPPAYDEVQPPPAYGDVTAAPPDYNSAEAIASAPTANSSENDAYV